MQGEGTLVVSGGSLELANALASSTITDFSLFGGSLTGAGSLEVTGFFNWEGTSTVSGSGSLVIASTAEGHIHRYNESSESMTFSRALLVNEGTVKFDSGTLYMSEGAEFENKGTFEPSSSQERAPYGAAIERPGSEGAAPLIVNTGLIKKTENSSTTKIDVRLENRGSIRLEFGNIELLAGGSASEGSWSTSACGCTFIFGGSSSSYLLVGGSLAGAVSIGGPAVSMEKVSGAEASVTVTSGSLSVAAGYTTIGSFALFGGSLTGAGTLDVLSSLNWEGTSAISGSGSLVLEAGGTGRIHGYNESSESMTLEHRTLVNEGTIDFFSGTLYMSNGAILQNRGTFEADSSQTRSPYHAAIEPPSEGGTTPQITNEGLFDKTEGSATRVDVLFDNLGLVEQRSWDLELLAEQYPEQEVLWGEANPSAPEQELPMCGESVSCDGNFTHSQTDFAIGGRGVGLDLTRAYNSQAATKGVHGLFGYGWSGSFSEHLMLEPTVHQVTLVQADGSSVVFTEGSGESFVAPAWTQDVLKGSSSSGYTLTLEDQTVYKFAGSSGRLESVTDRNGNATTLAYSGGGELETVTDPSGRKLKFAYNAEGLVESATDPMGHVVKYTYEGKNLMTVTQPGEAALRWQFKYNGSHQLTELTDGREGKTVYKYTGGQVTEEVDPMSRVTTYEYLPFQTKTTNHSTGAVTMQDLNSNGLGSAVTKGYGTSLATTERFTYNTADEMLTDTNGDGYTTEYSYEAGNRTKMIDPDGDETKWTYDSTHDVHTMTTPDGETTTTERNADGDPETVSRPAPGSTTQVTKYTYDAHGDETSMEDPLKRVWKYEYDEYGDRKAEIDPEGDKRTWVYNEDSQETSTVSARGNVSGAKEELFKTTTERDAQGRPTKVTAPLKHETTYKYDADGNLESETDPEGNKTTYTYNADNEQTKVEQPNKDTTETEYDGAGQVISQADGNKHKTEYKRNVLEQVDEIVDPLGHKTLKEYDDAGNLTKVTDAETRVTTYKYDHDNRLLEVTYSDGKTPNVKYEYNKDGDRTKMEDGTGTTSYEYDQLDRLTHTKDGHGNTVSYEYDLANEQTKITYPNGKAVTRAYDNAGRLKSVTDWLEHTTKFGYDADSNLTATTFPTGTSDEDTYTYNEADAMSEVKMKKGTETLASITYTRNKDEGVTEAKTKGLPGEEKPAFSYDKDNRITKGAGTKYEYDEANNPTLIGSNTYSYNAADELEKAVAAKTTVDTYTYNEVGERTKTEPATGAATTYGYDQAGNLTTITRAKSGETPAIEDTYAYNGDGLRASQTITGATTYLAWDTAERLPLILNDGTNSYIYGPDGLPFEQISSSGTVLYLHHDQQGSTRLLTSSTGTSAGTATYDAYGTKTGSTGTSTTPMGYDAQYTSADTGLIYLRAREYDPAAGQFLTVDPAVETTRSPYDYAGDDPVNAGDPSGRELTELEFTRQFGRKFARINQLANKRHINIELFDDYALAGYYAKKFQYASYTEDVGEEERDLNANNYYVAHIGIKVAKDFAPLAPGLETAESAEDIIKTLVSVAANVFEI